MQVVLLPMFPLWLLASVLDRIGLFTALERVWQYALMPLRSLWGFIVNWFASRPYSKLWMASPILLVAVAVVTIFYINANQNSSTSYQKYYKQVSDAMDAGDYKQADFLFSKIIHHPYYKDNGQVLFEALMVAQRNGNMPRMLALRTKLIQELKFEPAMRWFAQGTLQQATSAPADIKLVMQMAQEILQQETQSDDERSIWLRILASAYMKNGEYTLAEEVFKDEENKDVLTQLLLARLALAKNEKTRAQDLLQSLLAEIDRVGYDTELYLNTKIDAMALWADIQAEPEQSEAIVKEIMDIVHARMKLAADRRSLAAIEAELYGRLFQYQLKQAGGKRNLAFKSLDRSLQGASMQPRVGSLLHEFVDDASQSALLAGDLNELLAQDGGCVVHLALGLAEWNKGNKEAAMLHFQLAKAVESAALDVLRHAAKQIVEKNKNSNQEEGFLGLEKNGLEKALDLLAAVRELDGSLDETILFDECELLAAENQWQEIANRLEPRMKGLKEDMRQRGYEYLINAHTKLGNTEKVTQYEQSWYKEQSMKEAKK